MTGSSAIIFTQTYFSPEKDNGKTAHGLIRGTCRFKIQGVIDEECSGKDAGEVLDGQFRDIPIAADLAKILDLCREKPEFLIIGAAFPGGLLPESMRSTIEEAINCCISIVSGLHQYLSDDPVFKSLAEEHRVEIIDIRKPRPTSELHFWEGDIFKVRALTIAVLGIDCAVGKRTTAHFLTEACKQSGISADMVYTGQSGWLQGYRHGFVLDSVVNDFVSGELERAIVECDREEQPDVIFIEGQSSLRNPSGPCGSELLVSANADAAILQYLPFVKNFEEDGGKGIRLPDVLDEIKLISMYGVKTIAITLNGKNGTIEELARYQEELSEKTDTLVISPLVDGVDRLIPSIRQLIRDKSEI